MKKHVYVLLTQSDKLCGIYSTREKALKAKARIAKLCGEGIPMISPHAWRVDPYDDEPTQREPLPGQLSFLEEA